MRVFTVVIAIAAGVLILFGYFYPPLAGVQGLLLNWALIFAGSAALVGVFNILFVHADKIRRNEKGSIYSAFLIVFLVATLIFGFILGPEHEIMKKLVMQAVILPVEASLLGILVITLLYAAIRLLRRRADVMSIIFLSVAILVLLGSATLPGIGDVPLLGSVVRPWVTQILALGGARGILIGVALGTLTTGLRVLFGADRPYGGN